MDSVYNNTNIPLNASQQWFGKSELVTKYHVAMVSCVTDTSGVLGLMFSLDNLTFDILNTYQIQPNVPFVVNQAVQGKNFKASFLNNSGVNQTYLRLSSVYKDDVRAGLDIRPLNDTKDKISIPIEEIDIDQNMEAVKKYNIRGVPVLILADDDGTEIDRMTGMADEKKLLEFIGA